MEAHCRQKSTSLHDVRYLNDLRGVGARPATARSTPAGSLVGGNNKFLKCVIHPKHLLKMFCANCNLVISLALHFSAKIRNKTNISHHPVGLQQLFNHSAPWSQIRTHPEGCQNVLENIAILTRPYASIM